MAAHSNIVGGSTAERTLACPASWQAIRALPPTVEQPSRYAEEGTFAHEVMSRTLRIINHCHRANMPLDLNVLVGQTIYDREVTRAHIDELILPALFQLRELEQIYADGGEFRLMAIEQGVKFPGIPNAFGTCDAILTNDSHILVVDWKFGQGVPVKAVYPADDGYETLNAQLMFYITAALHTPKIRTWFKAPKGQRTIVGAIIQPRTTEPLTHAVITRLDIRHYKEDLHRAVGEAFEWQPRMARGEHCRFAPCKVSCPLWTGPLLDLTALGVRKQEPAQPEVTEYAKYLAAAKRLLDSVELMRKEVDAQMLAYLQNGGTIPGWRLKAKAKQRKWIAADEVSRELTKLGFADSEIFTKELVTFTAADATAKRRRVKIPEHLRVMPPSHEFTLATTDDPAPVVEPAALNETFRAALRALSPSLPEVTVTATEK
jgi:Protein of unknown function (DUF2800)